MYCNLHSVTVNIKLYNDSAICMNGFLLRLIVERGYSLMNAEDFCFLVAMQEFVP